MSKIIFPSGKTIFTDKLYTNHFLELTLSEIQEASEFTGFLKAERDGAQHMLFFLKGKPYAAGKLAGQRPVSCTIKDFFEDLSKGGSGASLMSLHETDPAILKCMLVFLQREPAIKASARLLNFDDILRDVGEKTSGALIILKKADRINFFFFLQGKPVLSRYAAENDSAPDSTPVMEQLLLYAYPADLQAVDALIYLNIETSQAADAEYITGTDLGDMSFRTEDELGPPASSQVILSIAEGPDLDKEFTALLPCTIGRKEGEIILKDRIVSGRHATMRESNGKLLIEDLDSTNGTYVNGIEIKAKELFEGDVITIGSTRLLIKNVSIPGP